MQLRVAASSGVRWTKLFDSVSPIRNPPAFRPAGPGHTDKLGGLPVKVEADGLLPRGRASARRLDLAVPVIELERDIDLTRHWAIGKRPFRCDVPFLERGQLGRNGTARDARIDRSTSCPGGAIAPAG